MKHKFIYPILSSISILISIACTTQTDKDHSIVIKKTEDFTIDGKGNAGAWQSPDWVTIPQGATTKRMNRNPAPVPVNPIPPKPLATHVKMLYSDQGIYFLFKCEDRRLQATFTENFKQVWWEDVVEIFIWPDENNPVYYEYQLSPLNYIRITEHGQGKSTLHPLAAGEDFFVQHHTSVQGGNKESGASIDQWKAAIYIPYELIKPLQGKTPVSGNQWRLNLYRFDFDSGDRARWEWQPVEGKNHDLDKFGRLKFE